ncbi:MAG: hypothetical protein RAO92_05280, partial [Candidatus Euphemobacter frigidus]|nr:hypothetical protein [Candidatus Euphemobacter frigidus]
TGMWRQLIKETGYDYWEEYILGKTEEKALPRPWTKLTNEEIDRLTRWAYVSYHSRPGFLFRMVRQVHSFDEFKRKFLAFMDMVFKQEDISRVDKRFLAYDENAPGFTSRYQRSPRLPH